MTIDPERANNDSPLQMALKLPFNEAATFFQNKLNIPTQKWDDLWKEQHAKGFMVAGAYRADLLADLRSAVDKSISGGMTIDNFKREFDAIVERYGWSYNGSRKWRSELIYNTNVRQAYNAGRWQQITDPDVLESMPYIRYRHGDSAVPRPLHLSWDGITLPPDDPWWKTHGPKNGWGCTCYVESATREEYAKATQAGKTEAPDDGTYRPTDKQGRPLIDPTTGKVEQIPNGIDRGWDYNVGEAAQGKGYAVLTEKFESMDYDIARKWISSYVNEPAFGRFIGGEIGGDFPVAVLSEGFRKEIGAESQVVWLSDATLTKNKENHPELDISDYRKLPDIVENAELVIEKGGEVEVFIRDNEKLYFGVVKKADEGDRLYLTSIRLTSLRDAKRESKKGRIVRNELGL